MAIAAIYARVSSERQKEEQTISSQTAAVKELAESSGLEVPEEWIFEDEGFSGAILVRPALERLRDLVAQVPIEIVLCHSPDRLARKYAHQALLIEELTRAGTEVRFVKGPKASTPEDELLLQFQGMIAEYERAQITERTRRGKLHRAKNGSVNVLSGAPYGYQYIRKTEDAQARYEIDEAQAAVVRRVFSRYTEAEEPLSIGALARWLSEQGIPTKKGKPRWDRSTVWGMLRNPAYCGRAAFAKTRTTDRQPRITRPRRLTGARVSRRPATQDRPRQEWIEIPVPPIVSEQTFELAARRLRDNRRFSSRRTKEPSLLQGLLVCKSCGYAYYRASTRTSRRKLYYYRCLGSDNYRWENGRVCNNRPVRQDYLDELVWKHVTGLLADPALIARELDHRLKEIKATDPALAHQAGLERELTKVSRSMNRLVDAYQEDLLPLDELRSRMPELRKRETSLRSSLSELDAHQADQDSCLKLAESLEGFVFRLRDAADDSSVEDRQRVLRLLVKEVLVDSETIVIRHSIPSPSSGGTPGYLLRGGSQDGSLGTACFGSPSLDAFHDVLA